MEGELSSQIPLGATGAQVQVKTEIEHLPLSYLTGAARKLGYLCTNSH